jgi:hypothetical protein
MYKIHGSLLVKAINVDKPMEALTIFTSYVNENPIVANTTRVEGYKATAVFDLVNAFNAGYLNRTIDVNLYRVKMCSVNVVLLESEG